jgi:hypothetical protein
MGTRERAEKRCAHTLSSLPRAEGERVGGKQTETDRVRVQEEQCECVSASKERVSERVHPPTPLVAHRHRQYLLETVRWSHLGS